jgi:cell division septum initiation protein DivIVA
MGEDTMNLKSLTKAELVEMVEDLQMAIECNDFSDQVEDAFEEHQQYKYDLEEENRKLRETIEDLESELESCKDVIEEMKEERINSDDLISLEDQLEDALYSIRSIRENQENG